MGARVHRIKRYFTSAYLLEGADGGLALVDAGLWRGHPEAILERIGSLGRRARDLRLVVVTHPHLDHFGGLAALRERADFDVACHPDAVAAVAEGGKLVSPGLRASARLLEQVARASFPWLRFRGGGCARGLPDRQRLQPWGIGGLVLHTPGHTPWCLSLLLDDGTALVGDLLLGPQWPHRLPRPPTMAVDLPRVFASWQHLLDAGATRFLPGHGDGCSAAALREAMRRSTEGRLAPAAPAA